MNKIITHHSELANARAEVQTVALEVFSEPNIWAKARSFAQSAIKMGKCQLACQLLAGFELMDIHEKHTQPGRRTDLTSGSDCPRLPWQELVEKEMPISRRTADIWIAMAKAARPAIKKIAQDQLPFLMEQSVSSMTVAQQDTLTKVVHKITDEKSQIEFMKELGICKYRQGEKGKGGKQTKKLISEEERIRLMHEAALDQWNGMLATMELAAFGKEGDAAAIPGWQHLTHEELETVRSRLRAVYRKFCSVLDDKKAIETRAAAVSGIPLHEIRAILGRFDGDLYTDEETIDREMHERDLTTLRRWLSRINAVPREHGEPFFASLDFLAEIHRSVTNILETETEQINRYESAKALTAADWVGDTTPAPLGLIVVGGPEPAPAPLLYPDREMVPGATRPVIPDWLQEGMHVEFFNCPADPRYGKYGKVNWAKVDPYGSIACSVLVDGSEPSIIISQYLRPLKFFPYKARVRLATGEVGKVLNQRSDGLWNVELPHAAGRGHRRQESHPAADITLIGEKEK